MKNYNLSISNSVGKCSAAMCKVPNKVPTNSVSTRSAAVCKIATEIEERLLTKVGTLAEPEIATKVPTKVELTKVPTKVQERLPTKAKKTLPTKNLPTTYRSYTPKIRQQIVSNKLLNSQLYELYTVRKLHCMGKWLKANIVDGTITIAKQTYIVSWLDILPIDAYKEEAIVISLRSPKYKDSRSKEYSLAYAVVSKIVE